MKKRYLFKAILLALGITLTLALIISMPLIADDNCKKHSKEPLRSSCDCQLVAQFGITDEKERLLVWKAPLKGDIEGYILWWFEQPGPSAELFADFQVRFYKARWEIFDQDPLPPDGNGKLGSNPDAKLLLAGYSAGETLIPLDPPESDGIWDGRGKVTKACKEFRHLRGRRLYEGGPVIMTPVPHGVAKIRIEGKRYCKRYRCKHSNDEYDDEFEETTAETLDGKTIPEDFELLHNYPNPFNPETMISFQLPEANHVVLRIFSSL